MGRDVPCPVCDMLDRGCKPIMAMALGVALGDALDQQSVTEIVCVEHRTTWVMAMCSAAVLLNTIDDDAEDEAS